MRTENLERCFAERKEGFASNHHADILAQPVEKDQKGGDVEHAERPDLPFINQEAEGLLVEMGTEPAVMHAAKEDADGGAECDSPPGNELQGHIVLGGASAEPEPDDPDHLPGKEIERAGFLEGN